MSALARFADSDLMPREVREVPTTIAVAAPPAGNSARGKARWRIGEHARRNRIHARIAPMIGNLHRPESPQRREMLGVTRAEQSSPGMRTMGSRMGRYELPVERK